MLNYILATLLILTSLVNFFFCIKSKKPIFTMIFNAIIGLLVLCTVDFSAALTGVYIPINEYTVSGSAIFGIPAVILFLVLKFIFI